MKATDLAGISKAQRRNGIEFAVADLSLGESAGAVNDDIYPVSEYRLDNGLRVVASHDRSVPAVAVHLWYDVGSRHERGDRTGLAHLFEHLMFQGSVHVGPVEHFSLLQAAGATLNGTTSFDRTNYYETVPTGAVDLALWLEADRMGSLLEALTGENLDNQRDVVKNERRQRYDNVPYGTAWERLFAMLFDAEHPYHHMPIGSMAHLDAATLDDCAEFFGTYYAPGNAVLAVVGDIEPAAAFEKARRYFGGIPGGPAIPGPKDGSVGPAACESRAELDADVPADAVYCAYRLPMDGTEGMEAADIATRVLGDGASSRLTRRLVRRDQLAQSVSFSGMRMIGGVSVGTVVARAAHGVDVAELAGVLDEEIADVVAHGVTRPELDRAKVQAGSDFYAETATLNGRAESLAQATTQFGDPAHALDAPARTHAVDLDAVHALASEYLVPSNRAVLTYRRVS